MSDEEPHLTDHWPVAAGHELDQGDWDAVKALADEWAGRSDDGQWAVQIPALVDVTYPGRGGRKDNGEYLRPVQLTVIHTAECPLKRGYALSLSRWGADSAVQASWHRMSDPGTVARFVPITRKAWHATIANGISRGYEQAGYAAFPREVWLTDDGLANIDRLAQQIVADGIPADAVRWLTDDEVRRALAGDTTVRGLCDHAQIQPKTRTDPGKGYPRDVLLQRIRHHHPDITTPAESEEDDDMKLTDRLTLTPGQRKTYNAPDGMTVEDALEAGVAARVNSSRAARDAAATLEIVKAQAAAGRPLTGVEIEAAAQRGAKKALDERIADADVVLEVTPGGAS